MKNRLILFSGFSAVLVGFWLGRSSLPDPAAPAPCPEAAPAKPAGPQPKLERQVEARCGELEAERDAARQELAFQKLQTASLELRAYGQMPEWPDEIEEGHAPDEFAALVYEAADACGLDPEALHLDCDEPPCLVISDDPELRNKMMGCPVWTDAYGQTTTNSNSQVECPDGTTETLYMLGPGGVDYSDAESDDPWVGIKRLWYRQDQARANYACGG